MAKATKCDPPYDTNGNGSPETGIIPMVMATFWKLCHKIMVKAPIAMNCPTRVRARRPILQIRHNNSAKSEMVKPAPIIPNCSPMAEKMKSVDCTGMNPPLVRGPCKKPFPVIPPVDTALLAKRTCNTTDFNFSSVEFWLRNASMRLI